MPRRSLLTVGARRFLRGPRFDRTVRGIRPPYLERPVEPVILPDGHVLNGPESIIYRALVDLGINFSAQVALGPGRALGGALVDFLLPDHGLDLDYYGPFHYTTEGAVRDFYRDVTRETYGIRRVRLTDDDLRNPHASLRRIIGQPIVWATSSAVGRR